MTSEEIDHEGYRIVVCPQGNGWVVFTYPPGLMPAPPEQYLQTQDPAGRDALVSQAREWIARQLGRET